MSNKYFKQSILSKIPNLKEISIDDINFFNIGHSSDSTNQTGVSVIYLKNKSTVGCDISGGGPASRETPLASPLTADNPINAIVLSGGSAYGLAASDGVMKCLEENKIGYDTGAALVPLVCQSCIYDLAYKDSTIRPTSSMGYDACKNALASTSNLSGKIGGGCGATVGKIRGMEHCSESGLGISAISYGDLKIAAIVVVNALGDIYNPYSGDIIAGVKNDDGSFSNTISEMAKFITPHDAFTGNTTIGAIITNASLDKSLANKMASMTRNAYSRCINPVGTMADGDSIYVASAGDVACDVNVLGTLSAEVMELAILNAIESV